MSGKSWAIGIIVVIIIAVVGAYYLTDGFNSIPQLDGSTQLKVLQNGSYIGDPYVQIGDYKYYFAYYPSTILLGQTNEGHLLVFRQDEQGGVNIPLTTNVPNEHLGMTFTITQVKPDYVIINAKATS